MPIQVECSGCGRQYRFSDEKAGRTVRCKDCDETIEIVAKRHKGGTKKRRHSERNPAWLIGGGIAGLLGLGLSVFLLLGQPAAPPNNPIVGHPNPVAAPTATEPAVANSNSLAEANPSPTSPPATPLITTPASAPTPAPTAASSALTAPPPAQPASGFQKSGFAAFFKPVTNWKVPVDPPAENVPFEMPKPFQIKTVEGYLQDEHVLFPETASRFALVGSDNDSRTVWNLATAEKGETFKVRTSGRFVGFSPDGRYIAWYKFDNGGGIEVYDIPAKKSLGVLPLEAKKFNVAAIVMPTPNRLIAVSDVNRGIVAWTLPSGDRQHAITLPDRARPGDFRAFSPGGRYLAVLGDAIKKVISIFDLETGTLVGEIEPTQGSTILFGMAFSPDGQEFAAAFMDSLAREPERIGIWNVADGSLSAEFQLSESGGRKRETVSRGHSLQWFPDRQRLLLNGMYVIDRTAKDVVYVFPKPSLDTTTLRTRRVLSNTVIANWEGTRQSAVFSPLELKAAELARAKEVVSAGGLLADAKLPKLTLFDRNKGADRSEIPAGWRVTSDPGSTRAKDTSLVKLPLPSADGLVTEIVIARGDSGLIGVRYADSDAVKSSPTARIHPQVQGHFDLKRSRSRVCFLPIRCRTNWIELHDADQRQPMRRIELDFPCELMSVSPDGSRVLVQALDGEGRLDLFAVDGSHVVGCRPFQDEPDSAKRRIVTAEFVDANTVAACSADDRLVVFRVPSCEPVYRVDDAGTLAISPGGKLLATSAQQRIDVRNALTGEGLGSLKIEDNFAGIVFSPSGDRLAVLNLDHRATAVYVIDLSSGSLTNVPIPKATLPLVWTGENHLLVGSPKLTPGQPIKAAPRLDRTLMLVDLQLKAVVWSCLANVPDNLALALMPSDGRMWWTAPHGQAGQWQLVGQSLPEPTALQRLGGNALKDQALVKPGSQVDLQVIVTEPTEVADFAKRANAIVAEAVKTNQVTVQPGSPLRLIVAIRHVPANGTMTLETFGLGLGANGRQQISIQRKAASVRIAYESAGQTLWESKHDLTNSFIGFTRLPEGKTPQEALDGAMWEQALTTLRQNFPPAFIFKSNSDFGLGSSRLTSDGAVAEGK